MGVKTKRHLCSHRSFVLFTSCGCLGWLDSRLWSQCLFSYFLNCVCLLLFSHEVLSDSLRSHGLQHIRLSCPFLSSGICSNSCPFSQSCHPTISSCHPLFLLLSTFLSIRGFSNELALCIRWSKYWSFSFSISPSNEYLGLISFRIDWLDLLAVQGTLKSLLHFSIPQISFSVRFLLLTLKRLT